MKNQVLEYPENLKTRFANATGNAIPSGQIVVYNGDQVGLSFTTIPDGTTGVLLLAGRFRYKSPTGAAWAVGDELAYDSGNNQLVLADTNSALPYVGRVGVAKASAANVVEFDLNAPRRTPRYGSVTVSAGQAAANSNNGRVVIATGVTGIVGTGRLHVQVLTATTGLVKSGYAIVAGGAAGEVNVDGVNAGTQIDAGDVVQWVLV